MSLLVVHDTFVVQLRRSKTQLVVKIWRSDNETIGAQKGSNQFSFTSRRLSEFELSGVVIQAWPQLLKGAGVCQLLEMPIHRVRPLSEILAPINTARPQMLSQLIQRSCCHANPP